VRYEIRASSPKNPPPLEINETTYKDVRDARNFLLGLLQVEEDYDILMSNYLDLEKTVHNVTLEAHIRPRMERVEFDKDKRFVNRALINLFSSARAFGDHTKHHCASISGKKSSSYETIHGYFDRKKDHPLSFRAIEIIRNHAQHFGLPAQAFVYQGQWKDWEDPGNSKLLLSIVPSLLAGELRTDRGIDKKLLHELISSRGEEVPLLPLVREYVSYLSSIAFKVRLLYADRQVASINILENLMHHFEKVDGGSYGINIIAVRLDEESKEIEKIPLSIELEARLKTLQRSNPQTPNLHKFQIIS